MSEAVMPDGYYRKLLQSVMKTTPDLIYFKDRQHRLVHVGQTYADLFEVEPEALLGEPTRELWPNEADDIIETEQRVLEGESVTGKERLVTHPDGEEHWYSVYKLPIRDDDGSIQGLFAIDRDITQRKELEERLSVVNRILRHDIRSAVNVIRGNARLARKANGNRSTMLDTIVAEADHLHGMSEKARVLEEALASTCPDLDTMAVDGVIRSKLLAIQDDHRDVSVQSTIEGPAQAEASVRIGTALDAILSNAVRHNDSAEPELRVMVRDLTPEEDWVEIRVADNGPGIPADELEPIESGLETDLEHTSGLGLWVAKWIIEESGGKLRFEPNEPRGTEVVIRLPAAE